MTDPITPTELPTGYYLAVSATYRPTVFERCKDHWRNALYDRCRDPRGDWHRCVLYFLPELFAAAQERDALRSESGAANYWRHNYAGALKAAEQERDEAVALLCDCADQFLMSGEDGTVYHSYMSTEEALCAYLVRAGKLIPGKPGEFRWADSGAGNVQDRLVDVPPGSVSQVCPGEDMRDCGPPCRERGDKK